MIRRLIQETTVSVVYRHACNDAVTAAIARDWAEHDRLTDIARSIERAYPRITLRARFAVPDPATGDTSPR